MPGSLLASDLMPEQLAAIRHPNPQKGLSGRDLLARFAGCDDGRDPRSALLLDLYVHTLQFGQVGWGGVCGLGLNYYIFFFTNCVRLSTVEL